RAGPASRGPSRLRRASPRDRPACSPLRQDIPHGVSDGLVALPRAYRSRIDDVVEHEVAFVERIARPGELHRAAPILLEELLYLRPAGRLVTGRLRAAAHSVILPRSSRLGSPARTGHRF